MRENVDQKGNSAIFLVLLGNKYVPTHCQYTQTQTLHNWYSPVLLRCTYDYRITYILPMNPRWNTYTR